MIGWNVALARGSALEKEAVLRREFTRIVPTLDPKLKAQLIEHLRAHPG